MGGIKNKLSKLSNKVKNLLTNSKSLPVKGGQMTKSSGGLTPQSLTSFVTPPLAGEPRKANNLASPARGGDLRSKSVGLNLLWDQRRQMKSDRISIGGFDRLVRITKYTSIACLSIAILSIITLNIISTYSSSNINSNAEPVGEVSTLANINPTSISISISSYPSATGDTNDGNLSLSIPQGGGLVAGRHTVSVNAGSEIDSYSVFLNGGGEDGNTDLVNTANPGKCIESVEFDVNDGFTHRYNEIPDNHWGVALPGESLENYYGTYDKWDNLVENPGNPYEFYRYTPAGIPPVTLNSSIKLNSISGSAKFSGSSSTKVYYIARIDDPSTMLAGDYTTNVVYTAIAELKTPSITSISPDPIRTGTTNKITLKGTNLSIVNKVTIDDRGTIRDCTNIVHSGTNNDTTLTCTLPAISNTGTYVITAETEGGQTATTQIQLIPPAPTISSVSPSEINTNDSTATLTIVGTNLATASSIYVDFNNNSSQDNGEVCTIQTVANTQIACTAPSRSTAGGPYIVRLTTDGGSVSKTNAVSYVTPVPTVTSVSPSEVDSLSSRWQDMSFVVKGSNLDSIKKIVLYLDDNITGYTHQQDCSIRENESSSDALTCVVYSWSLFSEWDIAPIRAEMYDASGDVVLTIDRFITSLPY